MRKLLLLILVLGLVLPSVLSWSATRTVSGNDVTITVDDAGTNGYIIKESIPAGLTVTSASNGGQINTVKGYVKWTFASNPAGKVLTYATTGSGTVSGMMTAGEPASEKAITGNTNVAPAAPVPPPAEDSTTTDSTTSSSSSSSSSGGGAVPAQDVATLWSAVRTISGNDVTITVDDAGTNGYIIKENIPAGVTVTSASNGGQINAAKGYVKWTFASNPAGKVLTYATTGSGTVSGMMTAGEPASEKEIAGDTLVSPPVTGGGGAATNSADTEIDELTQKIGSEIKASKDTNGQPQPSLSLFSTIAKLVRDFFFG